MKNKIKKPKVIKSIFGSYTDQDVADVFGMGFSKKDEEDIENINYRHEDMDDRFILKDSGKRQEFETGAVRDTQEHKSRYDLVPPHALKRLANIYTKGAIKYSDRNWEKGISFQRCIASTLRHIEAFRLGINDEDHLGQAAWNLFAIMEFQDLGREDLDDMIKYE